MAGGGAPTGGARVPAGRHGSSARPRLRLTRPALLASPVQGWSSLLLLLLMLALLGVTITSAHLMGPAEPEPTGMVPVLLLAAGLVGYVLARSRLDVVPAHLLGAVAGASVLLLAVAALVTAEEDVLVLDPSLLGARFETLLATLQAQFADPAAAVTPLDRPAALIILGAICWTSGQFAAFSVFRHDRGSTALVALAVPLFVTISVAEPQGGLAVLPLVVVFATAALLLLMRLLRAPHRRQRVRADLRGHRRPAVAGVA